MSRPGDFPPGIRLAAYDRQGGVCAFCGVELMPPGQGATATKGRHFGEAHHLRPLLHGGKAVEDNCVYLCYAHHKLMGHGMAPLGIDKQGGSSRDWVDLAPRDFPFWKNKKRTDSAAT